MRLLILLGILFAALNTAAETPANRLWIELKVKRDSLPGIHQEFDVSQILKTANGNRASKRQIVLDMAQGQWRERTVAGSGNHIRIFDGKGLFWIEEGGDEYVRTKRRSKEEDPAPSAYRLSDPDWSKAVELERHPCGIPGNEHPCVVLDVPLKKWVRSTSGNRMTRMLEGSERVLLDTETGMLMSLRAVEVVDDQKGGGCAT